MKCMHWIHSLSCKDFQVFSGIVKICYSIYYLLFLLNNLNLILECKIRLFNEDNGKSKILFVDVGLHRCVDCIFSVS